MMGRESSMRGGARRAPWLMVASLAVFGPAVAFAVQPAAAPADGLMKFEHVRVVNAPIAATTMQAPQAGMRAYIDADTGALRAPTSEELKAASAEKSGAQSPAQSRRLRVAPLTATMAPEGGGVGMELDESFMQYSVVVRQPDGSFGEVCVTGADKAAEIVKNRPLIKAAQHKESSNDR